MVVHLPVYDGLCMFLWSDCVYSYIYYLTKFTAFCLYHHWSAKKNDCNRIISAFILPSFKLVFISDFKFESCWPFLSVCICIITCDIFDPRPISRASKQSNYTGITFAVLHKPLSLFFLLTDWRHHYKNAGWQNWWSPHPNCQELSV